jgi:hypothetical protein
VLGSDIFTPADAVDPVELDPPIARMTQYAREYRGPAADLRERSPEDPAEATHVYAGFGRRAWGRFEGEEPDTRFRVLSGSIWRRTPLDNPEAKTYEAQVRVSKLQQDLIDSEVLDDATRAFVKDHVFENWTTASQVVSGKSSYSGAGAGSASLTNPRRSSSPRATKRRSDGEPRRHPGSSPGSALTPWRCFPPARGRSRCGPPVQRQPGKFFQQTRD